MEGPVFGTYAVEIAHQSYRHQSSKLHAELIAIRKAGVSISIESAVAGAAGMAVPILMGDQPVEYAILISAPAERFVSGGG